MNDRIKDEVIANAVPAPVKARPGARLKGWLRKRGVFGVAGIVCVATTLYWSLGASDRYVSQANVIDDATPMRPPMTVRCANTRGRIATVRFQNIPVSNYFPCESITWVV